MKLPILPDPAKQPTGEACGTSLRVAQTDNEPALLADAGFAGNVALVTLGCAKNLVDSEVMLGVLKQRGFRAVSDVAAADLIVVNTCAFLQSAVEEGVDKILELTALKRQRCKKLIVAGCMVERYRAQLEQEFPEVDRFVSTDELLTIADDTGTSADTFAAARRPYFLYDESMPRVRSTGGYSAFVKVAEGCDRPCAFCIIPKIRGAFRSRSIDSIALETEALLRDGVREINLVAQDMTSYGSDFPGNRGIRSELPQLLERLSGLGTEPYWLRMLYAYPVGVNADLLDRLNSLPNICRYLDLPLQHISNGVLKNMRRPLGEKGTRALIEDIRAKYPNISLRTTFIVGFPGETDSDAEALRAFVAEGHFTHVGVFPYSQEEEAASYVFDGQIDEEVKLERQRAIMETQRAVVDARSATLVGKRIPVLIEDFHEETDLLLSGRTQWQAPETDGCVILNDATDEFRDEDGNLDLEVMRGKIVTAEVTGSAEYDLIATIVGPADADAHIA